MGKILTGVIASVLIGTASYVGYKEIVDGKEKNEIETVAQEEKEVAALENDEVKEILRNNLESIKEVLERLGEENSWNTENQADFKIIKPEVLAFSTDKFAENKLSSVAEDYFCECDEAIMPLLNYDLRFEHEQVDENKIVVKALETSTEMINMGYAWDITLIKEEEKWKLDNWEMSSLEGQDLQLTKEEALKVFTGIEENIVFEAEYESTEAGGKGYIFKIEYEDFDVLQAVSSKDTRRLYNFEEETGKNSIKEEETEVESNEEVTEEKGSSGSIVSDSSNQVETIVGQDIYSDYIATLNLGLTTEEMVAKYGNPLEKGETAEGTTLTYSDAKYTISSNKGMVYKVEVLGEKVSRYYPDFEGVISTYFDDEQVYANFDYDEVRQDGDKYYLEMTGWDETHLFGSKNETGSPIDYILIECLLFK